ncbi:hypothetical protein [Sinosporangium siamense]|uniref:Uncharacterized protein n=1 Tax=Sinosporangium siamense TaxID=1367973 RepID=A0A919RR21_9ACTN|nr:hypothetical protein [Sinosporangium siamense]GII97154.1 hypothetical protein Ssi02_73850 [Sinosporangium siamense]
MICKNSARVVFGGATIAAIALVAVTGGGHFATAADAVGNSQDGATAPGPLANHDPDVREAMLNLFSGSAARHAAQEELVRRCMERHGFTYVKNPSPTEDIAPTLELAPYGLTVDQAEKVGYNAAVNAGDAPGEVDRSGVSKLSPDRQRQWGEALFGPENAPEVSAKIPGGGVVGTTSKGCLSDAKKKLYGSLSEYAKLTFLGGNLPLWAKWEAAADTDIARINASWAACISGKGFANLKSPDAARKNALSLHREFGVSSAAARDREISLAVADAECDKATDYSRQRIKIEDRHFRAALEKYAAEVADIRKMNASALVRANEVLGKL